MPQIQCVTAVLEGSLTLHIARTSDNKLSWVALFFSSNIKSNADITARVLSASISDSETSRLQYSHAVCVRLQRLVVLGPSNSRCWLATRWNARQGDVVAWDWLSVSRMMNEVWAKNCNRPYNISAWRIGHTRKINATELSALIRVPSLPERDYVTFGYLPSQVCLSVVCLYVCLSVMFLRPTQPIETFGNVSTPFCRLDIQYTSNVTLFYFMVWKPARWPNLIYHLWTLYLIVLWWSYLEQQILPLWTAAESTSVWTCQVFYGPSEYVNLTLSLLLFYSNRMFNIHRVREKKRPVAFLL